MSKTIIVRVQSPDHGTKMIEVKGSEITSSFLNKVQSEFGLGDTGWYLYTDRNFSTFIRNSRAKKVDDYQIRHGDMLYMKLDDRAQAMSAMEMGWVDGAASSAGSSSTDISGVSSSTTAASIPFSSSSAGIEVPEDEVDVLLSKQDGKIYRDRNEQFCRHGPKGKCLHRVPLEPHDEQFLKSCDPPVKFLAFHSYLRKLTGGVDKGTFVNLENISCKIEPGCKEHPPWPGGICTKCQPNAVTLNRQTYRHVDYIMFENPWWLTGCSTTGAALATSASASSTAATSPTKTSPWASSPLWRPCMNHRRSTPPTVWSCWQTPRRIR